MTESAATHDSRIRSSFTHSAVNLEAPSTKTTSSLYRLSDLEVPKKSPTGIMGDCKTPEDVYRTMDGLTHHTYRYEDAQKAMANQSDLFDMYKNACPFMKDKMMHDYRQFLWTKHWGEWDEMLKKGPLRPGQLWQFVADFDPENPDHQIPFENALGGGLDDRPPHPLLHIGRLQVADKDFIPLWLQPEPCTLRGVMDEDHFEEFTPCNEIFGIVYDLPYPHASSDIDPRKDRRVLRRYHCLGDLYYEDRSPTGHALVVDVDEGHCKDLWLVLSPETTDSVNDMIIEPPYQVRLNDKKAYGRFRNCDNRTTVARLQSPDLGPGAKLVLRLGKGLCLQLDQKSLPKTQLFNPAFGGPRLAHTKMLSLNRKTGMHTCTGADGTTVWWYDPKRKVYHYSDPTKPIQPPASEAPVQQPASKDAQPPASKKIQPLASKDVKPPAALTSQEDKAPGKPSKHRRRPRTARTR